MDLIRKKEKGNDPSGKERKMKNHVDGRNARKNK